MFLPYIPYNNGNGICHFASIFRAHAADVKGRAGLYAAAAMLAGCASTSSAPPPLPADYYQGEGHAAALDYRRTITVPTPKTQRRAESGTGASLPLPAPGAAAEPMPAHPVPSAARTSETSRPQTVAPLPALFFARNGYRLDARARATVRALAPRLAGLERIVVTGCTDETGPTAFNRALAERRAMAVVAALQEHGIEARFEIHVDTAPAMPRPEVLGTNAPADARSRARRVEIALEGGAIDVPERKE